MYCENCGKKLIRGYQFCMECGTPVPPEVEEEEENEDAQANEQSASEQPSGEMPGIQPIGNEEGTLVFCPTCGMRMQKSTDHCEKCGMKLNANGSSGVPLVNTDPLGGEFGGISDSDLARIDNFVNNSGLGGDISYDVSGGSDDMGGLGGGLGGIGGLGGEKKAVTPTAAEAAAAPAPAVPTNVGKDFVSKRKIFVIISSSIIVLTIIFTFVLGVKVDIRFKGGSMLTYSYSGEIGDAEMNTVKSAIAEIGNVPEVNVTTGTSFTGGLNTMVVSFAADEKMDDEMLNSINAAVEGALPDNAVENIDTTNVSASSGSSFFVSCLIAVVAAFILLAVYIAFRFQKIGGLSAGIIAIICLLHDVAITYAVYVFGGMTLDSNFMAVILTLLGYSINNTIIIYDRLRENRAKYGTKLTDTQLVNLSINQTMPRSIITTATTVCAMVSVSIVCALMGTTSILTFSIPLAIGMLVGFYSSVCLAGPIWIWVQEKRSKKTA